MPDQLNYMASGIFNCLKGVMALCLVATQGQASQDRYNFGDVYFDCLDYVAGDAALPFGGQLPNLYGDIVRGAVIETRQGAVTVYLPNEREPRSCQIFGGKLIPSATGHLSNAALANWAEDKSGNLLRMAVWIFGDLAPRFEHIRLDFGERYSAMYLCDGPYSGIIVSSGVDTLGLSVNIRTLDEDEDLRAQCLTQKTESKG